MLCRRRNLRARNSRHIVDEMRSKSMEKVSIATSVEYSHAEAATNKDNVCCCVNDNVDSY